jgi:hypothetical protein
VLNGRIYRAAFAPFVLVLAVAAFSLSARPHPLTSSLAPDAFDSASAFAELNALATVYPDRAPGSRADDALARHVAATLRGLGAGAGAGYSVRERSFSAITIDGVRTLRTVIATRPGSTSEKPIVILAHRDSAAAGGARAELSGTAALLELARVFAARETKRTLVIASTSGGSGGNAGAADLAAARASAGVHGPLDAVIVLGDLAGASARGPFITGFSDGVGAAPIELQRTVSDAVRRETGVDPGAPGALVQFAHLAFGLAVGEQAPLDAAGVPAVLVQRSGERAPPANDRVGEERLAAFGRAVLSAIDALDGGRDVPPAPQAGVVIQGMTLPEWAVRLLVGTLLFPALVAGLDGAARARRRRAGRRSVRRASVWALSCALPFAVAAVFARLLGAAEIVSVPAHPLGAGALAFSGAAVRTTSAVLLVLLLAWLAWPVLLRSVTLRARPASDVAGLGLELVLLALAVLVWAVNPYAALLLVPAAHLVLLLSDAELRPRPRAALAIVGVALLPVALLAAFYAHHLSLGPGAAAWMAVSLVAGGAVGLPAAIGWSIAAGCAVGAVLVALAPQRTSTREDSAEPREITIRGPLTYAGPGSLGGTESALRR